LVKFGKVLNFKQKTKNAPEGAFLNTEKEI